MYGGRTHTDIEIDINGVAEKREKNKRWTTIINESMDKPKRTQNKKFHLTNAKETLLRKTLFSRKISLIRKMEIFQSICFV